MTRHAPARQAEPGAALQAQVLHGVLPYLQSIHGKTFVVLCEGMVVEDPVLRVGLGRDVALLTLVGLKLVLLHGGSPRSFSALEHQQNDLLGVVAQHGCNGIGLTAVDGGASGLGAGLIQRLHAKGFVPVVAPVAEGANRQRELVDADLLAADIARQLDAQKLLFLLDSPGAMTADGELIHDANERSLKISLRAKQVAPAFAHRLLVAADFVAQGGNAVHLIDGRHLHALLLEVLSNGQGGTTVLPAKADRFLEDSGRYLK